MDVEDIYSELKKGVRKQKTKTAVFLCGAAGSGKTTSRNSLMEKIKIRGTHITINLDMLTYEYGKTYDDARTALKTIFEKSVNDGYNVLYDGTCRYPPHTKQLMQIAKENGYMCVLILNYAKLATVIQRIKKRVEQPVSTRLTKEIYAELEKNANKFMTMDAIDELYLVSNEDNSKIIFSRKGKAIQCISPDSEFYFDVSEYC